MPSLSLPNLQGKDRESTWSSRFFTLHTICCDDVHQDDRNIFPNEVIPIRSEVNGIIPVFGVECVIRKEVVQIKDVANMKKRKKNQSLVNLRRARITSVDRAQRGKFVRAILTIHPHCNS